MSDEEYPFAPENEPPGTRRWLWLGLTVLVLAGLGVGAKPGYRALKGWRAGQMAAAAELAMTQQNWPESFTKGQAAYQLAPEDPRVLRTMARLQGAVGKPAGAIPFWLRLKALPAWTPDDRRQFTEDLLRIGAVADAQAEIQTLLAEQPPDARNFRLAAQGAAAMRAWDQAIGYARRAQEIAPTDPQSRLLLGGLLLISTTPASRDTGMQALLSLATEGGPVGLEALLALANRRDLPAEALAQTSALLKAHPGATENHRLLALDLDLLLRPGEKDALLDATATRYQAAEPEAQRAFGAWLNGRREYERALAAVPLEKAFKRKDLLLVHLDARAALGQWTEIERIVARKQVPLDTVYAEIFLARAAMEQGKVSEADLHWRRANVAAGSSPEQMMFLGSYAEKVGETHQAKLAYRELSSNASVARPAFAGLLRLAERQGDTAALSAVLGEMKRRWPGDLAVLNDATYLSLLLAQEVAENRRIAAQLVAKAPASLPHRTTLALAAFRQHDAPGALAVYAGLQIPWEQVAAGPRAIYAAVLGLNGQDAEARVIAAALRVEDLRAEERELIKPWRAP